MRYFLTGKNGSSSLKNGPIFKFKVLQKLNQQAIMLMIKGALFSLVRIVKTSFYNKPSRQAVVAEGACKQPAMSVLAARVLLSVSQSLVLDPNV